MPIALTLYAAVIGALTWAEFRRQTSAQNWLKPLAALGFIGLALMAGAMSSTYGYKILTALMFCAAGDVLLLSRNSQTRFQLGMLAFAIGHLIYAWAFWGLAGLDISNPLAWIAIVISGLYFAWLRPSLPKDMVWPVAIYTLIILVMMITAFGVSTWIIPLAAVLFAVSDMFVARDRFVKDDPFNALAITPLYFGAQASFALSVAG